MLRPRLPLPAVRLGIPLLAALAALTGCSGTDSGGIGDPPSTPVASACGGGDRMHNVIGPAYWLNDKDQDSTTCMYPVDRKAQVSGLRVIAIDRFDETGTGAKGNYYVQEACSSGPLQAYSGATVYSPSFSPPDLRLAPGDVVDFIGTLSEFGGPTSKFPYCRTLPELAGSMSFRFESTPNPEPVTIPVTDLKTYPTARKWLGMLVRVEGLAIADDPSESKGRYTAPIDVGGGISALDVPYVDNELFDLKNEGPKLAAGTKFKAVTGIVTYFYGFKIAPRGPEDFEN